MFKLIAFIAFVGAVLSGVCLGVTFLGGVAVWLSTFLTTPLFQNTEVLLGEIWGLCGWSLLAYVISMLTIFASYASER